MGLNKINRRLGVIDNRSLCEVNGGNGCRAVQRGCENNSPGRGGAAWSGDGPNRSSSYRWACFLRGNSRAPQTPHGQVLLLGVVNIGSVKRGSDSHLKRSGEAGRCGNGEDPIVQVPIDGSSPAREFQTARPRTDIRRER